MTKEEIFLHLCDKAVELAKYVIPALITLHMKQPRYMRKKEPDDKSE